MKIVIIGGSVSGLMHGVMLKHHGHSVHILERVPRNLEAQGAGVGTTDEVTAFLATHDRSAGELSLPSDRVRVFDATTTLKSVIQAPMQMCTWDAMYYRLRANFDRLATPYCPSPPPDSPDDGPAVYDIGKELVGVDDAGDQDGGGGGITVHYHDRLGSGQSNGTLTADLVIAADGASSTVKALLAPHAPPRQYAGYVAWRGILPETAVSAATRDLLSSSVSFHTGADEYAVVYPVPGKSGSLAEGERALNFVWYSWTPAARLADCLTDVDGCTHRWAVPAGKLRREVWEQQRDHGVAALSKEFGEMLEATETPFLQVISDCPAPSNPGPALCGGRVLLVGDAQCLVRPHTGFALNQAARHCREIEMRLPQIEDMVKTRGKGDGATDRVAGGDYVVRWNQTVLDFGHIARLRSTAIGMMFLKSRLRWLPAMLHWKAAEAWLSLRTFWQNRVLGRNR